MPNVFFNLSRLVNKGSVSQGCTHSSNMADMAQTFRGTLLLTYLLTSYSISKLFCLISPVFFITGIIFHVLNKGMAIYFLVIPCKIPPKNIGLEMLHKPFRYSHFPNYLYPQKHNFNYKFPKIQVSR
jgi:hypothetical protein